MADYSRALTLRKARLPTAGGFRMRAAKRGRRSIAANLQACDASRAASRQSN
jgi:hypothetical protein